MQGAGGEGDPTVITVKSGDSGYIRTDAENVKEPFSCNFGSVACVVCDLAPVEGESPLTECEQCGGGCHLACNDECRDMLPEVPHYHPLCIINHALSTYM